MAKIIARNKTNPKPTPEKSPVTNESRKPITPATTITFELNIDFPHINRLRQN
jgi:hypothetical protein